MSENYLKIYKVILWIIIAVFFVLFIVYLVNSFYTHKQTRINESMITDLAWDANNIKLRQLRVLEKHNYIVKNELLVFNVKLSVNSMDDLPIILLDKSRRVEIAKYYVDFKILVIQVANSKVDALKVRFGLMKCVYILMILGVVWQIKRMLIAVEKQKHFEGKEVGNCLGWISMILVLVPVFNFVFNFLLENHLKNLSAIDDFKFQNDNNFDACLWIAASTFCVIMSRIVSRGEKIKQEQDLTI